MSVYCSRIKGNDLRIQFRKAQASPEEGFNKRIADQKQNTNSSPLSARKIKET